MSYSITQNTVFLTVASILQKIVSFAYFIIIARLVGVHNTGQYFFAIAFTTIFTVVADFGLGPVLTREMAKDTSRADAFINTVFGTKLLFGLGAYALVVLAINALGYPSETKLLIYVSGVTMWFDNLQSVFFSTFRAHKNLIFESTAIVASQFLTLVIGTVALYLQASLVWLILAYTIPSALVVCYGALMVKKMYGVHYTFVWDRAIFKTFMGFAWAFAVAGILSRLYAYTDSILISKFLPPDHLGWWSVPYKITFAFQFLPIAIATSLYPVASSSASEPARLRAHFTEAWRYLFLIVFPLSFGLMAVAQPIIVNFFGVAYLPSVSVLSVLLLSLIFGFLSFISGAMLNATNRQTRQTMLIALALITDIALNVVLLPRYGLVGAALAALAGNFVLCTGGYIFCNQFLRLPHLQLFKQVLRTALPALLMAYGAHFLVNKISVLLVIPLAAVSYGILLFITGALTPGMLKTLGHNFLQYD